MGQALTVASFKSLGILVFGFDWAQTHDLHITSKTCNPLSHAAPVSLLIAMDDTGTLIQERQLTSC